MQFTNDITNLHFSRNLKQKAKMDEVKPYATYRDAHGSLIAETPCTWENAKLKLGNNDIEFGRTIECAKTYKENIKKTKKEWKSIDSYCKHHFLKYPYSNQNENGGIVKYVEENAISTVESGMVLERNNYPYHLSPGIEHYVVWSVRNQSKATYEKFVNERFPSNAYDVIIFENSEQNKSVKSVVHVHVFVRNKTLNLPLRPAQIVSRM
ncbi:uncharacterized protein LOC143448273 [Clavelina lepadiformis]|uniref:uncharacterized protein LOC143448273 n=1 Tax=Clavelina lepadiformis TaxID=159417 RepID=UPI0040423B26